MRFGLRIVRAMQSCAARGKTAERVANQQRDALQEQERGYDVKPPARFGLHIVWAMQPFIARAEAV